MSKILYQQFLAHYFLASEEFLLLFSLLNKQRNPIFAVYRLCTHKKESCRTFVAQVIIQLAYLHSFSADILAFQLIYSVSLNISTFSSPLLLFNFSKYPEEKNPLITTGGPKRILSVGVFNL